MAASEAKVRVAELTTPKFTAESRLKHIRRGHREDLKCICFAHHQSYSRLMQRTDDTAYCYLEVVPFRVMVMRT